MRWKTDEIMDLIYEAVRPHYPQVSVERTGPGGDWDTANLVIKPDKISDPLYVCGFRSGVEPALTETEWDDGEVEMIELKDGLDSRGGLNSGDIETSVAYAVISSALRRKGWSVVPQMKDYH